MALNVVLMTQRQSPNGMALTWGVMEGVASYTVFIATRKLSPEELEAAMALGGTDDCVVAKFGAETLSVVDDISTAGEARFYGVAMSFSDGAVRAARFRCVPDGATPESRPMSGAGKKAAPAARPAAAAAPRPAAAAAPAARPAGAAPSTGNTGSFRVAGAAPAAAAPRPAAAAAPVARPAAAPAAEEDPLEARKRAQREARARMAGEAAPAAAPAAAEEAPAQEEAPAEEDPMEARKRAQREARERAAAASSESSEAPAARAAPAATEEDPMEARRRAQAAARAAREGGGGDAPAASAEPVKQPSEFPLDSPLEIRMSGGTQTWDGLRIYWEREPRAAAYEIVVSDHQIFSDELGEALSGKADFTAAVAVPPSVTAIIDNITPREARGWYLVLVRNRDGSRVAHPFKVGDAAESGKAVAGFVNPNRTGELRAEVEDLLGQAKENWDRWKSEQDGGAKREAQRLVKDALLIFPNYPAAKTLAAETAG